VLRLRWRLVGMPPKTIPRPCHAPGQGRWLFWAVPEFGDVQRVAFSYRIYGGLQAQKFYVWPDALGWAESEGGQLQPGARLRFRFICRRDVL
jgi:hypothetical protein